MTDRCDRCCLLRNECRCLTSFRPIRCFRCDGGFEVGQQYRSDAANIVYHAGCYVADAIEIKLPEKNA